MHIQMKATEQRFPVGLFAVQVGSSFKCVDEILECRHLKNTGGDSSNRGCFGRKTNYSGNLEILPGIGKPGKFFGKNEIFSGH